MFLIFHLLCAASKVVDNAQIMLDFVWKDKSFASQSALLSMWEAKQGLPASLQCATEPLICYSG